MPEEAKVRHALTTAERWINEEDLPAEEKRKRIADLRKAVLAG